MFWPGRPPIGCFHRRWGRAVISVEALKGTLLDGFAIPLTGLLMPTYANEVVERRCDEISVFGTFRRTGCIDPIK